MHTNVELPKEFDMFNLINNPVIPFPGKQQAQPREKSEKPRRNPGYSMTTAQSLDIKS